MITFVFLVAAMTLIPSVLASLAFTRRDRWRIRDLSINWFVAFIVYIGSWFILIEATGFQGHTNVFIVLALIISLIGLIVFNLLMHSLVKRKNQKEAA